MLYTAHIYVYCVTKKYQSTYFAPLASHPFELRPAVPLLSHTQLTNIYFCCQIFLLISHHIRGFLF